LINITSVVQSIEDEWITIEESKSDSYGRLSKANRRCVEEQEAAIQFQETMKRDKDGRFVLRLPIKPEVSNIGKTLHMATSRFLNVERRLQRDEGLRDAYVTFMKVYKSTGHMKEVDHHCASSVRFYLPNNPVLKESSLTS